MSQTPFTPAPERVRFVEDLLDYMTLEEKAGQLVLLPDGSASSDPTRIDQLRRGLVSGFIDPVGAMRTHQLQQIAIEETRLGIPLFFAADPAQVLPGRLPAPVGMAASWNPEAVAAAEEALAEEYLALGLNWAFSPVVATTNYLTDVGFEQSFGESAWLAEQIAAGRVRGLQAQRSEYRRQVLATLDFAFNDRTGRRGEGSLREREQFRAILKTVEQAAPATIGLDMIGQGRRNVSRIANDALKNLRRAGGFDGILLADWAQLAEKSGHHAEGPAFVGLSVERLVAAVEDGRLGASELDEAVRRVLAAKFDLGLFRPSEDVAPAAPARATGPGDPAHDLASKSIILLRNQGGLLPLSPGGEDVLVVGSAARDRSLAFGGSRGDASSIIDGLEALGIAYKFVAGLALREGQSVIDRMIHADRMAIGMAGEAARRAGTVIAVLGQGSEQPGEPLGEAQTVLLETLRAANPRTVLVTLGSRPCDPDIGGEPLPCILHAGTLGTQSGHAIAEILSGQSEPSARLPYTIRTRSGEVRLPFGHGLSYGEFTLGDLSLELGADRILASARLRNIGERRGEEMLQLYLRRLDGLDASREAVLRGFQRIALEPGQSTQVTFELAAEALAHYDAQARFKVEAGDYEVRLGFSAARVRVGEIALPQPVADAMNGAGKATTLPLKGAANS
ncbi:glycoside hydrolase family 3 C-terminal domain-containing protein [Qipengyuania sp. XHP0211]|uniref:glycoside hydrolase family 3 C-terminal domain-containing protein n=1 Tax=Qipengyuania sp. XHP0211 TaxID=3038079 RepID=UPI00241C5B42|nr:glycoside hydrolase family 3 C-terminal domain-containing protein [Qipengyuania sp. XHP0211]MDG5750210.1 glycoside hydrolase family 3 C-terminal domain-containing protein [Qipengyuania sp. XHP0211]